MKNLKTKIFITALAALATTSSMAANRMGTGSYGDFDPKPFLEASTPWTVYRFEGPYNKSGYPCDNMGNSCRTSKEHTIASLRSQRRTTGINVGIPTMLGKVLRNYNGTQSSVELRGLNNVTYSRLDQSKASSRMGADGSEVTTATKTFSEGLHGISTNKQVGHVEGKGAAWARTLPHSFYYTKNEKSHFGLTFLERMTMGNMVKNFFKSTPGAQNIREGSFWCKSDNWRLSNGFLEKLIKNDEFDMSQCDGTKLLTSKTETGFGDFVESFFLNRQDSNVTLHTLNNYQYHVESKKEWFCPFDCDGTNYSLHFNGQVIPKVRIDSDKWNYLSRNKVKVKVVRVDWDDDGFYGEGRELKDLVSNPAFMKDIVAIIITEMADTAGKGIHNGNWTQKSFISFPPKINGRVYGGSAAKHKTYAIKLVDGILAMMPDQTKSSPELRDIEEKIDELRLYRRIDKHGISRSITSDIMFDIYKSSDPTTTVTWKKPTSSKTKKGKIEWTLKAIGVY